MDIVLYGNHCPRCQVLEAKLQQKKVSYNTCENIETMENLGIMSVPVLSINGNLLAYKAAIDWVNQIDFTC